MDNFLGPLKEDTYSLLDSNNDTKINVIKQPIPVLPKPILKRYPLVNQPVKKQNITYADLLNNMGLYVDNGQLQTNAKPNQNANTLFAKGKGAQVKMECSKVKGCKVQPQSQSQSQPDIPQNSYIYNKYFKDHLKPQATSTVVPKTREEYTQILIQKLLEKRIQQQRISQIKSTRLIMPTNNIHISPMQMNRRSAVNLNRLFTLKGK